MNKKNLLVSFVTIAMILFLVANVSAADFEDISIFVDDVSASNGNSSVVAGETVTVKIWFQSLVNVSDLRVKAEIEGDKIDVDARTESFDVEAGYIYRKTLTLKVPYELKDQLSDDVELNLKIWGGDAETLTETYVLRVLRQTYNADIKSISVPNTINAGETFPVDVVVKNIGYNDLDDLYVTLKIPTLSLEKRTYFGDLVSNEWDYDEEEDTVSGRIYLTVPYDVEAGVYTLEVEAANDDYVSSELKQISIKNSIPENVIQSGDNLLIINPTKSIQIYKVISPLGENFVVVQAGASYTFAMAEEGEYHVFCEDKLVKTVSFDKQGSQDNLSTSPIVVLTIILAIVFLVLVVVLIVLLTKKPEKTEEFGESYY